MTIFQYFSSHDPRRKNFDKLASIENDEGIHGVEEASDV